MKRIRVLLRLLCVCASFSAIAVSLEAQPRAHGDWHGVLTTPNGRLTLFISIRTVGDTLGGYLESIDQPNSPRLSLAQVMATDSSFSWNVPAIGAVYEGKWSDSTSEWTGVFRQGMTLPLILKRGAPPSGATVNGLDGVWRGVLKRDSTTLRLVLRISSNTRGTRATFDSPDLSAFGLAVESLGRKGDSVRFAVPMGASRFEGLLESTPRVIRGNWTREGLPSVPIVFTREDSAPAAPTRSQMPITPSGYSAHEVTFANTEAAGVILAGTLTLPDANGRVPAVVLISGSGPQDRDETVFGHKPFAVLADHLSRRGIAVLRYDDRGFGKSTGRHAGSTSADFATDANAAVGYLQSRPEIDARAIGFIGHSEGGMIGPIAAASNNSIAFMVLLAGPGTSTVQLSLSQRKAMAQVQGATNEQIEQSQPVFEAILQAASSSPDSATTVAQLRSILSTEALRALGSGEAQRELMITQYTEPWMHYFLRYDPAKFLSRLRMPVLALNGALDRQVVSAENLAAIRAALEDNPDVTVKELPGLNHMFQPARSGAIGEYSEIAETFSPSAMELIASWISERFVRRKRE